MEIGIWNNTTVLTLPCDTKFLQGLIFAIFPAIRKNKYAQKKNYRKHFSPQKFTPE